MFGVAFFYKHYDFSVVAERIVGLLLTFYMWTFVVDFFAVPKHDENSETLRLLHKSLDEELSMALPARPRFVFINGDFVRVSSGYSRSWLSTDLKAGVPSQGIARWQEISYCV